MTTAAAGVELLPWELRMLAQPPRTGPLLALLPPPLAATQFKLPPLPPRPSSFLFSDSESWICETFTFPGAYPRSVPGSARLKKERAKRQKTTVPFEGERMDVAKLVEEMYEAQVDAVLTDFPSVSCEEERLFVAVNRYRKVGTGVKKEEGLTMVFAHANGFHKEIWEPTLEEIIRETEANKKSKQIYEIYALDCVNQGDSAILNEATLGNTFTWVDNGRDILNFLINYIDSPQLTTSISSPAPVAAHETFLTPSLTRNPAYLSLDNSLSNTIRGPVNPSSRQTSTGRTIVGLGHSLGGAGIIFASTALPILFSSLILLDPTIPPDIPGKISPRTKGMVKGALTRRNEWKVGRKEAEEGFLKKEFFRSWDRSVLGKYLQFGLRERDGVEGVELKGKREQEALVFADPRITSSKRASSRLLTLPTSISLHLLFADHNQSVLDEPSIKWLLEKLVQANGIRVKGAGHLLVQEKPKETAGEIVECLRRTYASGERARL